RAASSNHGPYSGCSADCISTASGCQQAAQKASSGEVQQRTSSSMRSSHLLWVQRSSNSSRTSRWRTQTPGESARCLTRLLQQQLWIRATSGRSRRCCTSCPRRS
ncbi:hypothetical protein FQA47_013831, partial [Oryzias melastigma]